MSNVTNISASDMAKETYDDTQIKFLSNIYLHMLV
jgi:hypothetical protein